MALILDFLITSLSFIQFTSLRHFKDTTEHYILREHFFGNNESEEEEKEEETFQLFLVTWLRDISADSTILPSQICKWISTKMIIFGDN